MAALCRSIGIVAVTVISKVRRRDKATMADTMSRQFINFMQLVSFVNGPGSPVRIHRSCPRKVLIFYRLQNAIFSALDLPGVEVLSIGSAADGVSLDAHAVSCSIGLSFLAKLAVRVLIKGYCCFGNDVYALLLHVRRCT